ncbi:MAG TPA: O-antigen ligase family protein [Verrucomicrobiae bacterium]|nr:O-antigen ligase family protein [Verrucomicrobiae bacterium]
MVKAIITVTSIAAILTLFFFSSAFFPWLNNSVGAFSRNTIAVLNNPASEWIFASGSIYFSLVMILHKLISARSSPAVLLDLLLVVLLVIASIAYYLHYETAVGAGQSLIFFTSVALGTAVRVYNTRPPCSYRSGSVQSRIVASLILALVIACAFHPDKILVFNYVERSRWTGPWDNPNIYGLLMGVGAVLSFGFVASGCFGEKFWFCGFWLRVLLPSLAMIVCGIGLFESYSRGAWVSTVVGVGYLIFRISKMQNNSNSPRRGLTPPALRVWRNWLALAVVAVAVLCFWQFRFTEWRPARRVFSIANINDFSWRNRVTAWEGAVRMMIDRPFFGFGWGKAEDVYQKEYCPPQLESGLAIQMNDYFMLGISAGVPALICFLVYVALSLRRPRTDMDGHGQTRALDWLQAVCGAGAIVLLVGFWFDGGLFKLATGSVFWILLELGKTEPGMGTNKRELSLTTEEQKDKEEIHADGTLVPPGLKWTSGVVAALALLETIVLVGAPFLPANRATLALARRWLVAPKAVGDLDFLSGAITQKSKVKFPLGVLLQHANLANYDRQLVNWSLDDEIYRNFVLTPTIDPQRDARLARRRALWEYFYPTVRKENDPLVAAEIVMKFLHGLITIVPRGPLTIQEMWKERCADAKGFEVLKVAAFRAVGIPARLSEGGKSEILEDGKWAAPEKIRDQ